VSEELPIRIRPFLFFMDLVVKLMPMNNRNIMIPTIMINFIALNTL
jgi:hypothetical protein